MADVFSVSSMPVPATPVKAGLNAQTTELSPDYTSPAPKYSKTIAPNDQLVTIQTKSKPFTELPIMSETDHPVLPIGDVFIDIRNHLSCHSIFNSNIETLLKQYLIMQDELNEARTNVARLERVAKTERLEKEAYKHEVQELKRDLTETRDDLNQTRSELTDTQYKLSLSIKQLMETSEKLGETRKQLREALREVHALGIQLDAKENELQYCKKRIAELEIGLGLANKAENDANDRNVRLTHLLYEIEAQKASIERAKDKAEARVRELEDELENGGGNRGKIVELEKIIFDLKKEITRLSEDVAMRDTEIVSLQEKIVQVTEQRDEALREVAVRDDKIVELEKMIESLRLELADVTKERDEAHGKIETLNKKIDETERALEGYENLVNDYRLVVKGLRHKKCMKKFKHLADGNGHLSAAAHAKLQVIEYDYSDAGESADGEPADTDNEAEPNGTPAVAAPEPTTNDKPAETKNVNDGY